MKLKIFSWIFFILSILLTFVSLNAGFYLYSALFTLSTAVLICSVFEVLRISSLYAVSVFTGVGKYIVLLLYLLLAGICFFASVISLDTQIIEKSNAHKAIIEQQIENDLYKIRSEYSKQYQLKIESLEEKRETFQKKIASNPKSKYYNERLSQVTEETEKLDTERTDKLNLLTYGKISREAIKTHLSILNIETGGVYELKDISNFEEALQGIFNFDLLTLKKMIGYSLAFGIEAGILLLAILGFYLNSMRFKIENTENKILSTNYNTSKLEHLIENINAPAKILEYEPINTIIQNESDILSEDQDTSQKEHITYNIEAEKKYTTYNIENATLDKLLSDSDELPNFLTMRVNK